MVKNSFYIFIIFFFSIFSVSAGKIEKGFACLKIYNYFEAKQLFEKSLKKQPAPAQYGLAIIYASNDNPFYNLDSAFNLIQRAEKLFPLLAEKEKEKLKLIEVDYDHILALRQNISSQYFKIVNLKPSEIAFQTFLNQHPWANENTIAIHRRDSLAYLYAVQKNSSSDFQFFIDKYSQSEYLNDAKNAFDLRLYQEKTVNGTLGELELFLINFPNNPYKGDAEDRIYTLSIEKLTIDNYEAFIRRFPSNRNVEDAWRKLYQLYMYDYSEKRIVQFLQEYPDYPFKSEVEMDRALSLQQLFPYKTGTLFGWMNEQGDIVFSAEYESLAMFSEGLALAAKEGKYGYVDKSNQIVIPFKFDAGSDFESGRAIVELNGKLGIIDRTGKFLFDVVFNDLGQFSEGLIYGSKDSLYAYYDKYGLKRLDQDFEEAFSFANGMAKVKIKGKEAFVNPYGAYIVQPIYEEINFFTDSLLVFQENDKYGIVNLNNQIILPGIYEQIGNLVHGKAIIVKNNKIGYINQDGMLVILPTFEVFPNYMENAQFSGNYAKAKLKDKFGIIDGSGKWIIPASYSNLGNISSLISFEKGKKWGFIDLTNKIILKPTFDEATSILDGTSFVLVNGKQGVINAKGEFIIPAEFDEIKRFEQQYFLVSKNELWGLFSSNGNVIVTPNYDYIKLIDKDLMVMSNLSEVHYYFTKSQQIVVPQVKRP